MNYGSDILATGEAKIVREKNPDAKIAFGDPESLSADDEGKMKLYWSDLFANNPNILQPGENADQVIVVANFPKSRPFINYGKTKYVRIDEHNLAPYKIAYNTEYEATRGELFFEEEEIRAAEALIKGIEPPIIVIDPQTDVVNKVWPQERWEAVIEKSDYQFVQPIYDESVAPLKGARHVKVRSFREACAVLKVCVGRGLFLGVDNHLHHAAAAVDLPAVVLWSHYSHPDNLGYDDHINVRWDAAGKPCGLHESCAQCRRSMEMIRVNDILVAIDMIAKGAAPSADNQGNSKS